MIDMNEIQRRARAARETASANMRETVEKGEALAGRLREKPAENRFCVLMEEERRDRAQGSWGAERGMRLGHRRWYSESRKRT